MKTLPACLLLGLFAAPSAAAADFSFTVGYGTARLDGGETSSAFLETKATKGNVDYARLSLSYDLTPRVGVEGSYFAYSDLTIVHLHDYSHGIPAVIPNNRFRRSVRAFALGPTINWMPAENWRIKAGAGGVLSDLRTTLDEGQEGVQHLDSTGNPGWFGSIESSYALSQQVSVGVSVRYIDFNRKMVSSSSLTAQQADFFVALQF